MFQATSIPEATTLPDVQSYVDSREIAIDHVGVTSVPYPIEFRSFAGANEPAQSTVGTFDMFVSLPASKKGTHMSRFMQQVREWKEPLSYAGVVKLCNALRERLDAESASIAVRFPFFVSRTAPASGETGMLRLDVELVASAAETSDLAVMVAGPAASLCPCSKEISEFGAHNQRCQLKASVRFRDADEPICIDELFAMMERSASIPVLPTVKRSDEKELTEQAYRNPKFVEDTVRDLAQILKTDSRISWFRCSSENFESIHQHNAFASVEMPAKS